MFPGVGSPTETDVSVSAITGLGGIEISFRSDMGGTALAGADGLVELRSFIAPLHLLGRLVERARAVLQLAADESSFTLVRFTWSTAGSLR